MTHGRAVVFGTCVLLLMLAAHPGMAADAPAPKEGHWVVRDFRFHTGEVLPEVVCTTPRSARRPASPC
jgi:hypothetical protein